MNKNTIRAAVLSAVAFLPATAHAGDNGAAFAVGIMGLMGAAMLASQARHQRRTYAPRQRYVVVHRTRYVAKREIHRVAAIPRAPAPERQALTRVSRDDATILRYFFDCRRPVQITAKAEVGFIRPVNSTRYVCGNPNHPVVQFQYVPSTSGGMSDRVTYFTRGRLTFRDELILDASIHPTGGSQTFSVLPGGEKKLWTFWNCTGKPIEIAAFAQSGFTTVRDGTAQACGSSDFPVKEVIYKASRDFAGTDMVQLRSSAGEPRNISIRALSATTPSNANASEIDAMKELGMPQAALPNVLGDSRQ